MDSTVFVHSPSTDFAAALRRIGIPVVLGVSAILSAVTLVALFFRPEATDFRQFAEAGQRVFTGELYAETNDYGYRWSPVLAYALGPLTSIGALGWRIVQVLLAATMPTRRLSLVVLIAYPFWFDVQLGNVNVLVLWLAAWALSGHRAAVVSFLALALLIPRPLMVPLVAWFLWREPWTRAPFVAMFGVHAGLVALSGWGDEWVARLVASGNEMGSVFNYGPSRIVGAAWIPLGVVLGAVAWWKGKPALAGLLVAPYWLPYYFLLPLAELAHAHQPAPRPARVPAAGDAAESVRAVAGRRHQAGV